DWRLLPRGFGVQSNMGCWGKGLALFRCDGGAQDCRVRRMGKWAGKSGWVLFVYDRWTIEAQMADYERAASQWDHNEYNCKNYILNALDDSLHKAKDYRHKKEYRGGNSRGNSNQANHVESPKEFFGVIESFLTTNVVNWWLDTGATKDICNSRRMFGSYQKVNEPEPMFMGNKTALKIQRKGKVILKLTSRKDLVLSNMLHVPNITKNLISGPILSNKEFNLVFELDKFVVTKSGVYVGKGYLDEGHFKLSIVTDDNVINNNNPGTSTDSLYMIDLSFL
nr:Pol polyprotein [Tanacetum cinerariifolium]